MPPHAFERFKMLDEHDNKLQTYFRCKFQNCDKIFKKSTSLIVHYWRHTDVRPFKCELCNKSFT